MHIGPKIVSHWQNLNHVSPDVSLDFRTLILETVQLSTLVRNLVLFVYTFRCITCPYMLWLYKLLPLMFYFPSEQKSRMLIE